jgi:nucleoid-associated protein YgaU
MPQVESWDEEEYRCKPNDTFRSISLEFYHTDKYERALVLFNRNHPQATDTVLQDPPVLKAGQPVYIPPIRILEKNHAAVIPELSSLPTSPRARAASAPAAGNVPLYRVGADGEMMLAIARRTLGDDNRWSEIYKLNPRFDPKQRVPAASVLRLPADARVPSENVP